VTFESKLTERLQPKLDARMNIYQKEPKGPNGTNNIYQKDQMCNIELIPVKAYPISLRIYILEVSQPEAAQCCVMILTVRDNMLTVPR